MIWILLLCLFKSDISLIAFQRVSCSGDIYKSV